MTRHLLLACLFFLALRAKAQPGPIEPTWVYTTRVDWLRLPGVPHSSSFSMGVTNIVILFPEGQYVEALIHPVRNDKTRAMSFNASRADFVRAGTWDRTDDHAIRIHSRLVWKDEDVIVVCGNGRNCHPREPGFPGPFTYENCVLEGRSSTHLAKTIRCKSFIFAPSRLDLDLAELQHLAALALNPATRQ